MEENKSYDDITLMNKRTILLYYLNGELKKNNVICHSIKKEALNRIGDYCIIIGEQIVHRIKQECFLILNGKSYDEDTDLLLFCIRLVKKFPAAFGLNEQQTQIIIKTLSYDNLLLLDFDYISSNLKVSILNKIKQALHDGNSITKQEAGFHYKGELLYRTIIQQYEDINIIEPWERELVFCFTRYIPFKLLRASEIELITLTVEERDAFAKNNEKLVTYAISHNISGEDKFSPDVIGDGYEGLARALNSFRKDLKFEFTTYAYKCIVRTIQYAKRREHAKNRRNPKDPNTTVFFSSLEETVTIKEGALGEISKKDLLIDTDCLSTEQTVENTILDGRIKRMVEEMLLCLSPQEATVLRYRFGIGAETKKQVEIAQMLNTTQSYVHLLEKRAKTKIFELFSENTHAMNEIHHLLN